MKTPRMLEFHDLLWTNKRIPPKTMRTAKCVEYQQKKNSLVSKSWRGGDSLDRREAPRLFLVFTNNDVQQAEEGCALSHFGLGGESGEVKRRSCEVDREVGR